MRGTRDPALEGADRPSKGSMHHVGESSIRYSFEEPLLYVSSPMNLLGACYHVVSSCRRR